MIYLAHNSKMLKADSARPGRYFGWIDNLIVPEYSINIGSSNYGSITASALTATAGTVITLTASPNVGYELNYFTLNGIAIVGDSFTMPAEDVTVSAMFIATLDSITIGTQTWTAKNLAIDDGQSGIITQTVNYGQGNITEYYYDWMAAVRVASAIPGWHLPTADEWYDLARAVGTTSDAGSKLKSTYGWSSGNGDGSTKFAALPAGYWHSNAFSYLNARAYFWSSTEYSNMSSTYIFFTTGNGISSYSDYKYSYGCSVRLVKDQT